MSDPEQVTIVRLHGELDAATSAHVSEQLDGAVAGGARAVKIDLAEVTFIDSTVITNLLRASRTARESGVAFGIDRHSLGAAVSRTLEVAGIGTSLDFPG